MLNEQNEKGLGKTTRIDRRKGRRTEGHRRTEGIKEKGKAHFVHGQTMDNGHGLGIGLDGLTRSFFFTQYLLSIGCNITSYMTTWFCFFKHDLLARSSYSAVQRVQIVDFQCTVDSPIVHSPSMIHPIFLFSMSFLGSLRYKLRYIGRRMEDTKRLKFWDCMFEYVYVPMCQCECVMFSTCFYL